MKNIETQLAFYRSYHRTLACRATHFIGVPLVTFSILVPMGWLGIPVSGYRLSLAPVFVLGALLYYFLLDRRLAISVGLCMFPLTWGAGLVSGLPFRQSLAIFLSCFISGWLFQIVGHAIEGRRPALLDNFSAVFTAPLFLAAELFTSLGWRKS